MSEEERNAKLDLSLDELAAQTSKANKPDAKKKRASEGPPLAKPQSIIQKMSKTSKPAAAKGAVGGLTTGTKVRIRNLDFGVTEADLGELFSQVGPLKKVEVARRDDNKSRGVAFVTFLRKNDAVTAIEKYNEVPLDGRPMQMALYSAEGVISVAPAADDSSVVRVEAAQDVHHGPVNGGGRGGGWSAGWGGKGWGGKGDYFYGGKGHFGKGKGQFAKGKGFSKGRGKGRGGKGRGGKGRGGSSAADLDADLDSYRGGGESGDAPDA